MSLDAALTAARQLEDALEREIRQAQGERELLRQLDASGIVSRATARQAFNARADFLRTQLADALQAAANGWGLEELTWSIAQERDPETTPVLRQVIDQVAALAAALKELDGLHRALVERTLVCLRAYTLRLTPRGAAYDRRGRHSGAMSHG